MDRLRDIQEFCLLATVRQRRSVALQKQLGDARQAHQERLARQAHAEETSRRRSESLGAYRLALVERTTAGRSVSLDQLQAARAHCVTLQESCAEAEKSAVATGHAVQEAFSVVTELVRQIAANDMRIDSLKQEVERWRTAQAVAAEDREEDERPERRIVGAGGPVAA